MSTTAVERRLRSQFDNIDTLINELVKRYMYDDTYNSTHPPGDWPLVFAVTTMTIPRGNCSRT